MTGPERDPLKAALEDLEKLVARKRRTTRFDARGLLTALGERILAGDEAPVEAAIERLRRIVAGDPESWQKAVRDELALACTEHVQSVDPRYLSHPRYDFAYTVDAREKLEARLQAASRLDLAPDEDLLNRIARADALLEPYLRNREGREGSN